MDVVSQHLLVGFVNLTLGLGIGWASRGRSQQQAVNEPADETDRSVVRVLDEMRETMTEQVRVWDALRRMMTDEKESPPFELGVHAVSNRQYAHLLRSSGVQLSEYDADDGKIPFEFLDDVAANRDAAASFADALEHLDPAPSDSAIVDLLRRLAEMEESNRVLRTDLDALRKRLVEQSSRLEHAEAAALQDHLTELPNRRAFDQRLRELESTMTRYGRPYCLLLIDLDEFKLFNDAYGHDAGDSVLKVAARVMSDACRTTDHLSRYGGEEFAVLIPETQLRGGLELAERIRTRIEQSSVIHAGERLKFTCSVGVAQADPDRTVQQLIHSADEALYAAKESGRNAVCRAEPPVLV